MARQPRAGPLGRDVVVEFERQRPLEDLGFLIPGKQVDQAEIEIARPDEAEPLADLLVVA